MIKLFKESPRFEGFDRIVDETKTFDRIVSGVFEVTSEEVFGKGNPSNIATFAYGSPGRIELIGGDSDADVFLAEKERTEQTQRFRKLFAERLEHFDFSKVDLTNWGSYDEIDTYLRKSLVEGNQVLETRFLAGDISVGKDIQDKKVENDSINRQLTNFIFNRLYFNQYFRQRVRNGARNIKYCHGGSRDLLFIGWHDKLDRALAGDPQEESYQPKVKSSLNRLYETDKITNNGLEDLLDAIGFSVILRSDILRINKNTPDKGLTFVDNNTLERLRALGYPSPDYTLAAFEEYRGKIANLSKLIFKDVIKKAELVYGKSWGYNFREALNPATSEAERGKINPVDSLTKTALIWGASESKQSYLLRTLSLQFQKTEDWATICSLACSPFCPSNVLDYIGRGIAKEEGYGYILRVIARNKNTTKKTLTSIAEDTNLEKRYTEVAKAALEGGNGAANNQI